MLDAKGKKAGRKLSYVLRHKPEAINIELDENGWANVGEILQGLDIEMSVLEEIVSSNDKQRFAFNDDKTMIRANQGHSIDVDVELNEAEPPYMLYHGTPEQFVPKIKQEGLQKMNRNHVHLSDSVDTAATVGKRRDGYCAIISVHAGDMFKAGYKFYLSENGVWLTDRVPVHYIFRISGLYGKVMQK